MDRMEQEIWKRVGAGRETGPGDLQEALAGAYWLAAAYRAMGKRAMAEKEAASAACLRGMLHLSGYPVPPNRRQDVSGEGRMRLRALAVRRCRQVCLIYASRLADPEYGPAFQTLAAREQEQLAQTLEMLGE